MKTALACGFIGLCLGFALGLIFQIDVTINTSPEMPYTR